MTVAVKIPQISDNVLIYSKGADTIMMDLLRDDCKEVYKIYGFLKIYLIHIYYLISDTNEP